MSAYFIFFQFYYFKTMQKDVIATYSNYLLYQFSYLIM